MNTEMAQPMATYDVDVAPTYDFSQIMLILLLQKVKGAVASSSYVPSVNVENRNLASNMTHL